MVKIKGLFALIMLLCNACNTVQPTQIAETGPLVSPLNPKPFLSLVNVTPVMTPSATLIPLPTKTLIPEAPVSPPTIFPTSFPTPETTSTLHCEHEGAFWKCFDELLSVEFKIPSRWIAVVQTHLWQGRCGGYSYGYDFEGQTQVGAGGESLDFCNPTEGSAFIGFREWRKSEVKDVDGCSLFARAVYCEPVNPNVVMAISFPESQSLCAPYADTIYKPIVQVGVNLPIERKVQGLLFTTHFLSIKLEDQLFEPLGGVNFSQTACADKTATNRFDDMAHSVAQAVIEGRADDETDYQLGLVREFAKSIQVNSP